MEIAVISVHFVRWTYRGYLLGPSNGQLLMDASQTHFRGENGRDLAQNQGFWGAGWAWTEPSRHLPKRFSNEFFEYISDQFRVILFLKMCYLISRQANLFQMAGQSFPDGRPFLALAKIQLCDGLLSFL